MSRFRAAGARMSRMMRAALAPPIAGALRSTGRSEFALLDRRKQVGVFLDFTTHPTPTLAPVHFRRVRRPRGAPHRR